MNDLPDRELYFTTNGDGPPIVSTPVPTWALITDNLLDDLFIVGDVVNFPIANGVLMGEIGPWVAGNPPVARWVRLYYWSAMAWGSLGSDDQREGS